MLKEYEHTSSLLDQFSSVRQSIDETLELLTLCGEDSELLFELKPMIEELSMRVQTLQLESCFLMEEDHLNAILEINAGAGGTEAQDFVEMLLRMYSKWTLKQKFKFKVLNQLNGNVSGIKNVVVLVSGRNAFGLLKGESGVHRIKRVSPHNAQGKRETSFASVHVVPELGDEGSRPVVEINKEDYEFQACRSGGAGGQNVNKRSTAVRLVHKQTGFIVACRTQRTQGENLRIALEMLKEKLVDQELESRKKNFDSSFNSNKTNISFGQHIRTYSINPTSYVKDERTKHMVYDIDSVLDGNIGEFLEKFLLDSIQQKGSV